MNFIDIVKNGVNMLDNNTISINNLTNKLCVTLTKEYNIPRTEQMENYIRGIFTRYKRKEIDLSSVTDFLLPIINGENIETITPKVKEKVEVITPKSENTRTIEPTVVEKKVEETPTAPVEPVVETPIEALVEEKKIVEEKKVIEKKLSEQESKDLKKNIQMLDDNTISVDNLTNKLANQISINYGVALNEGDKEELKTVLTKYRRHEIDADYVEMYYAGLLSGTSTYKSYVPSYNKGKSSSIIEEEVVEIDTDVIMETANGLAEVENSVNSVEVSIPSGVSSYAEGISFIVSETKSAVSEILDESKSTLLDTLNANEEIDDEVIPPTIQNMNFSDIYKLAYNKKQNSSVIEANAEFFRKCGYPVDGDVVTVNNKGKVYQYNMKSHTLTIDGTNKVGVKIYIPNGNRDYSKLNTYSYFAATITSGNGRTYDSLINEQQSNSIILQFNKNGENSGGVQNKNGEDGVFIKQYEVSEATKFINTVAKTDISSGKCRNIIGGDSKYGASSLIMAANYPDLYQTVYCVNNAAIVPGYAGAIKGTKTQFDSLEQLKKLDGKDIYFISTSNEDNFYHNKGWQSTNNYENGYTYNGIKLICENCPNANVHMVYNEGKNKNPRLIEGLKNLENTYSNYSYNGDEWSDFAKGNYYSHSQGQYITSQVASADATNVNYYTGTRREIYKAKSN